MQPISNATPTTDGGQAGGAQPAGSAQLRLGFGFADIAFVAAKRFWEFAAILVLVLAGGVAYIGLLRDPVYESEARLFVRLAQEQAPPKTVFTQNQVTFMTPSKANVTSEIDLLLNGDLVERVIEELNLVELVNTPPPPPQGLVQTVKRWLTDTWDEIKDAFATVLIKIGVKNPLSTREVLIREIQGAIRVLNTSESNVIVIRMQWPDPNVPKPLLETYLDEFLAFRSEIFRTGVSTYFAEQKRKAEAEIAEISARLDTLRETSGIHALAEQRSRLIGLREDARERAETLATDLSIARERAAALADASPGDGRDQLVLANIPDHPLLTALDERAVALFTEKRQAAARGQLAQRDEEGLQEAYASVLAATRRALADHIETLETRERETQARLAELQARLDRLAESEAEWRAMQNELTLAEESHSTFAQRLDEARSVEVLRERRISNVVVIQEPTAVRFAVGTRNSLILAVIGVFGVMLGLAWIALREVLDDKLYRASEIEEITGEPPLAVVPRRRRRAASDRAEAFAQAAAQIRYAIGRDGGPLVVYAPVGTRAGDLAEEAKALADELHEAGLSRVLLVSLDAWSDAEARAAGLPPAEEAPGTAGTPEPGVDYMACRDESEAQRLIDALERRGAEVFAAFDLVEIGRASCRERVFPVV